MYVVALVFFQIFSFSTVKKSSEVPERREFPVNEAINPCDNFYEYTCSKVEETFQLREDRSSHAFSFSDSWERLLIKKKSYLKNLSRQKVKTKGEKELSDVFLACLNTDQRASDEKALVEKTLKELESLKTRDDFIKFIGDKIVSTDFSFVYFADAVNQDNTNKNDLLFGSSIRGLPEKSYYNDKKVLKAYKLLLEGFFKTIGFKDFKKRAGLVVSFEKDFDKIYPTPQEWRVLRTQKNYVEREALLKNYEVLNVKSVISRVPKKTKIRVMAPKTLDFVKTALETATLDQLKSIYLYHSLSSKLDEGYKDYFNKKFAFRKDNLGGPKKRSDLMERCTRYVMSDFSKELDFELYPKVFKGFSKKKFVKLAESVRSSLLKGVKDNSWISAKGKKAAYKKMKKARMMVVKPDNMKQWDFLEAANYSPLHYLANQDLRDLKRLEKTFSDIKKGPNKEAWIYSPLTINAYYYPPTNTFVMLAGILQYPFYDQNLPDHVNLGAIGTIVGHELGHGIDDKGSKYDYKGRLNQWMTEADLKEFKRRGDRLVNFFDKAGENGTFTLGENIGDFVGLTASYNVAFPKGEGSIQKKKEFFTQYGRSWCAVMRPGEKKRRIKVDPHALYYLRVNEQVKHQPGFAEAFSCKAGDKMYLSEKDRVKIW